MSEQTTFFQRSELVQWHILKSLELMDLRLDVFIKNILNQETENDGITKDN